MCRSPQSPNLLDKLPTLNNLVINEDNFMRYRRCNSGQGILNTILMEPIWKIQSTFSDNMLLMERSLTQADKLQSQLNLVEDNNSILSSSDSDTEDDKSTIVAYKRYGHGDGDDAKRQNRFDFELLIPEYAFAADLYLNFIHRMNKLYHQARILSQSFHSNKWKIIDAFVKNKPPHANNTDWLEAEFLSNKIDMLLFATSIMKQEIRNTIRSGRETLDFALNNLRNISKYYYDEDKMNFPLDPLSHNFLYFHRHQIDPALQSTL